MSGAVKPVRMYAEEDFRLPRRLAVIFRQKIASEMEALATGNETFEDMKRRQGYIDGLKFALQECASADKELSG